MLPRVTKHSQYLQFFYKGILVEDDRGIHLSFLLLPEQLWRQFSVGSPKKQINHAIHIDQQFEIVVITRPDLNTSRNSQMKSQYSIQSSISFTTPKYLTNNFQINRSTV